MTALRKIDAHAWEREANEHYVEPAWCSERLLIEEGFDGNVYDPACGFGTIVDAALRHGHDAAGADIVKRVEHDHFSTADFLTSISRADNIICNPPFNIAPRFAQHALKLADRKVAMIFPVARLNAAHWIKGTPLQRVWLMSPRPSMPPGHVIAAGGKPGGGKMDYAWLVWARGYAGSAEMRWLYRDKTNQGALQSPLYA